MEIRNIKKRSKMKRNVLAYESRMTYSKKRFVVENEVNRLLYFLQDIIE